MSVETRVFPMRFSADVAAMVRFLEVLGLRVVLAGDNGTYAALEGATGSVAVHATETAAPAAGSGLTSLNVLVPDVDAAAGDLTAAGRDAAVWDEAYGRQGAVRAPNRLAVGLNEAAQADLYGYRSREEPVVPAPVDVLAVWYSDDFRGDAAFFADLGFHPEGSLDDPWWCALRGAGPAGVVGLHGTGGATADAAPEAASEWLERPALVRLGFETAEPLDALATRLRDAGYGSAAVVADEAGPKMVVTDPDGQSLEIHPRPAG
jgi:hypothetical protein